MGRPCISANQGNIVLLHLLSPFTICTYMLQYVEKSVWCQSYSDPFSYIKLGHIKSLPCQQLLL